MSIVPKAFFWFMVLGMVVSFILCWQDIAKLHNTGHWAWYFDPVLENHPSGFPDPTLITIRFLDLVPGKVLCVLLIGSVSFSSYRLAFERDCLYLGLFLMMAFAGWLAWVAIWLHVFEPFHPMIRM